MGMARKWISFIAVLAFVVTTMPFHAHASMSHHESTKSVHESTKSVQTEQAPQAADHEDCHHDGDKTPVKKASSDKEPCKGSCCDKNCKCVGNSCNGAAKVLGDNGLNLFSPTAAKSQFGISQERMVSNLTDRIKRPPRA